MAGWWQDYSPKFLVLLKQNSNHDEQVWDILTREMSQTGKWAKLVSLRWNCCWQLGTWQAFTAFRYWAEFDGRVGWYRLSLFCPDGTVYPGTWQASGSHISSRGGLEFILDMFAILYIGNQPDEHRCMQMLVSLSYPAAVVVGCRAGRTHFAFALFLEAERQIVRQAKNLPSPTPCLIMP